MTKEEAVKTLLAYAICCATITIGCDQCPRYSEADSDGPCKNAWTDEQLEAAVRALL